ncbi:hypothetical protein LXL04_039173 [Taraxacum kok-saghyz]
MDTHIHRIKQPFQVNQVLIHFLSPQLFFSLLKQFTLSQVHISNKMDGSIVRRAIPSDNSCLFNAVGYVMVHDKKKAPELRQVIERFLKLYLGSVLLEAGSDAYQGTTFIQRAESCPAPEDLQRNLQSSPHIFFHYSTVDAKKFPMWKTKAMAVLETLDYDMLDIVIEGPHVPMFQPMKDGVANGEKKRTPKHDYTAEDKKANPSG